MGYDNRIRTKYTAKWGVQIAGMIFQTRSSVFAQVRKDSEYKQTEEDNAMSNLSHLDALEAEAIYIMREVAAECEKPVMLYSIGKDSSVMLHLAMKAFYPEKPPFPFLHVNTTWKFREMIEFRDKTARELGIEMLEYINEDGVRQGINPFDHGSAYTDIMKTQALKQALKEFFHFEMNNMPGIRKTRDRKCGNFLIPVSIRGKVSVFFRCLTGRKRISGNI